MQHVSETVRLATSAQRAWSRIGGFGSVADWHPMLARVDVDGSGPGAVRTAHGKDGSQQRERLDGVDEQQHAYRYTMLSTALPVSNYTAEFRIDEAGEDASVVTWSARFDVSAGEPGQAIEAVRGFLRAGLDALPEKLAGAT